MSVTVIVEPTGEKATPEAIEAWKAAAQVLADDYDAEIELKGTDPDTGEVSSHLIAYPEYEEPEP